MSHLNYDPRPPERRLEGSDEPATVDKIAEGFIIGGQILIALGVVVFAVLLLIAMI